MPNMLELNDYGMHGVIDMDKLVYVSKVCDIGFLSSMENVGERYCVTYQLDGQDTKEIWFCKKNAALNLRSELLNGMPGEQPSTLPGLGRRSV